MLLSASGTITNVLKCRRHEMVSLFLCFVGVAGERLIVTYALEGCINRPQREPIQPAGSRVGVPLNRQRIVVHESVRLMTSLEEDFQWRRKRR